MLELGILNHFAILLSSPKKAIRKETCWAISNITAGRPEQIQAVIDNNLMSPLIAILAGNGEFDVRKEACWAVSNAIVGGNTTQIHTIVELGAMDAFAAVLTCSDAKTLTVALEALEKIFSLGDTELHNYVYKFEEIGGLDKLEALQTHVNTEVYEKSVKILETHFGAEEEDAPLSPPAFVAGNNTFNF